MEKSTKNMLIAAGAGAAVGAIAGILLAPAKGSETRAAIGGKVVELKDKIVNSEIAELAPADLIDSIKNKIADSLTNGKAEVRDELLDQIHKLENSMS